MGRRTSTTLWWGRVSWGTPAEVIQVILCHLIANAEISPFTKQCSRNIHDLDLWPVDRTKVKCKHANQKCPIWWLYNLLPYLPQFMRCSHFNRVFPWPLERAMIKSEMIIKRWCNSFYLMAKVLYRMCHHLWDIFRHNVHVCELDFLNGTGSKANMPIDAAVPMSFNVCLICYHLWQHLWDIYKFDHKNWSQVSGGESWTDLHHSITNIRICKSLTIFFCPPANENEQKLSCTPCKKRWAHLNNLQSAFS